jgi:exo-1,4-beta-D-glucosaminidase
MSRNRFFHAVVFLTAVIAATDWALAEENGAASAHRLKPSFPAVEATPLGAVPEHAVVLHKDWRMKEEAVCGSRGEAFSRPGFTEARAWYPTTVPTTTLATLVRSGVYPDPYVGLNNMRIPDASPQQNARYGLNRYSHLPNKENPWAKPYWFRTEFRLPAGFPGKVVWLHLDGINYRADVWVNGRQVGSREKIVGMFERFRFNVTDVVHRDAANAIAIRIHPLDHPGDPLDEQLGGIAGKYGPNGGDGEIMRNVTQYCTIGWDWVAASRDRNVGIWQHVWLEGTDDAAVLDPAAFVTLSSSHDSAALKVRFHCQNAASKTVRAEAVIRVEPQGFSGGSIELRKEIEIGPKALEEFIVDAAKHPELVMRKPRLWWPVGYGEHPLYTLSVDIRFDGRTSSSARSNLGVRTVGTLVLPSGGRAFTVNGRVIRLSGGAWVPDFLLSWGAQRYRDEVRLMAEGNHTVVRVNGCGIIAPEVFYDECDRRGLLVWQDFSRTSIDTRFAKRYVAEEPNCWGTIPCDAALLLRNMKDCILRMRSHPSLLLYEGCNEAAPQRDFGVPMQNEMLPKLDGTRPWFPGSHADPSWAKEPIHMISGGPYSLVRLPEYFRLYASDKNFLCKNEIGLTSPPPINSLAGPMPLFVGHPYGAKAADKELSYHDGTDQYYRATPKIILSDLGAPSSVAEYLFMADLYTNTAYRAIYEAANKVRPRNSGTHIWKINAAWTSMVQQVFDWRLCCNSGYYGMKSALRPLHVQTSIDDMAVQVVSTLATERRGLRVSIRVVSVEGRLEAQAELPVDVAADATARVGVLPPVVSDGHLHFVGLTLLDKNGAELDRTVAWVQKDCKWHELLAVRPTRLRLSLKGRMQQGDETTYQLIAENRSSAPAVQTCLSILSGDRGAEALPCFWSDNSATLLPGESKQFTVSFRTNLLAGRAPHLIAEGWNIVPAEIRLADSTPVDLGVRIVEVQKDSQNSNGVVRVVAESNDSSPEKTRIVTWPMILSKNGKPLRTFRIAVSGQGQGEALVPVGRIGAEDSYTITQ